MSVHEATQMREQIRRVRVQLADAVTDLGTNLGRHGDYAEAERLLRRAIAIYESCSRTDESEES
jgi:Flp pilus assembly protein TadD